MLPLSPQRETPATKSLTQDAMLLFSHKGANFTAMAAPRVPDEKEEAGATTTGNISIICGCTFQLLLLDQLRFLRVLAPRQNEMFLRPKIVTSQSVLKDCIVTTGVNASEDAPLMPGSDEAIMSYRGA